MVERKINKNDVKEKNDITKKSTRPLNNTDRSDNSTKPKRSPNKLPFAMVERWFHAILPLVDYNEAKRQKEKGQLFIFFLEMLKEKNIISGSIKDLSKIKEQLINNLQITENYKDRLRKCEPHPESIFSLSLLNNYFDVLGKERIETWIKYSKNINALCKLCAGMFEEFLDHKEIVDLKRKSNIKEIQNKLFDIQSKLLTLEKVYQIEKNLSKQVENGKNQKRPTTYFVTPEKTILEKGFIIKKLNVYKDFKLFGKTLDADKNKPRGEYTGKKHCLIVIEDRALKSHEQQAILKDYLNMLERDFYTLHLCLIKSYAFKNRPKDLEFQLDEIEIPNILENVHEFYQHISEDIRTKREAMFGTKY